MPNLGYFNPEHRERTSFDYMDWIDWAGLAGIIAGMIVLWRCS